jgi:glucokinase
MEVVCVDLGGTHVRFAIANVSAEGVDSLGEPTTRQTAAYSGLDRAWAAYAAQAGRDLPRAASLAVACPITGDVLKLTNSPWVMRSSQLARELGVDRLTIVNDFGAVGHATARLPAHYLQHVAGPDLPLPASGVIGVVGPGTGLGVAHVLRGPMFTPTGAPQAAGYAVMESEGGHVDWAPLDSIEDAILQRLRQRFLRVSVERIVSGPGLANIHAYLAELEGTPLAVQDDKALWQAALAGTDRLAVAALDRFCLCFGSIAGDIALAQGAHAMVIGGGVGARVAPRLPSSGFAARFTAKGRMATMLAALPVRAITHPEPGLFGAAAAFIGDHAL